MALSLVKKILKFEPYARTPLKEIVDILFFKLDNPYDIYDHPISTIPGLGVFITQSTYYNVLYIYSYILYNSYWSNK